MASEKREEKIIKVLLVGSNKESGTRRRRDIIKKLNNTDLRFVDIGTRFGVWKPEKDIAGQTLKFQIFDTTLEGPLNARSFTGFSTRRGAGVWIVYSEDMTCTPDFIQRLKESQQVIRFMCRPEEEKAMRAFMHTHGLNGALHLVDLDNKESLELEQAFVSMGEEMVQRSKLQSELTKLIAGEPVDINFLYHEFTQEHLDQIKAKKLDEEALGKIKHRILQAIKQEEKDNLDLLDRLKEILVAGHPVYELLNIKREGTLKGMFRKQFAGLFNEESNTIQELRIIQQRLEAASDWLKAIEGKIKGKIEGKIEEASKAHASTLEARIRANGYTPLSEGGESQPSTHQLVVEQKVDKLPVAVEEEKTVLSEEESIAAICKHVFGAENHELHAAFMKLYRTIKDRVEEFKIEKTGEYRITNRSRKIVEEPLNEVVSKFSNIKWPYLAVSEFIRKLNDSVRLSVPKSNTQSDDEDCSEEWDFSKESTVFIDALRSVRSEILERQRQNTVEEKTKKAVQEHEPTLIGLIAARRKPRSTEEGSALQPSTSPQNATVQKSVAVEPTPSLLAAESKDSPSEASEGARQDKGASPFVSKIWEERRKELLAMREGMQEGPRKEPGVYSVQSKDPSLDAPHIINPRGKEEEGNNHIGEDMLDEEYANGVCR